MHMTKEQRIEALALSWAESQKEVNKLHKKLRKLRKEYEDVATLPVVYSVLAAKISLTEAMYKAATEVDERIWQQYRDAQ